MLIIKIAPEENGAHANQYIAGKLGELPAGWAEVPEGAETAAMSFLPWVKLTVENGKITAVTEDAAAKTAFENLEKENANELDQ